MLYLLRHLGARDSVGSSSHSAQKVSGLTRCARLSTRLSRYAGWYSVLLAPNANAGRLALSSQLEHQAARVSAMSSASSAHPTHKVALRSRRAPCDERARRRKSPSYLTKLAGFSLDALRAQAALPRIPRPEPRASPVLSAEVRGVRHSPTRSRTTNVHKR